MGERQGTLIRVSMWVKSRLEEMKSKEGHTSLDSVIRVLLLRKEK